MRAESDHPHPAEPGAPDRAALEAFLRSAPEGLQAWAAAQLEQLPTQEPDDAPAGEQQRADVPDEATAGSDLALEELGEADDEPRRRPRVVTPMDKTPTPVAAPARTRRSALVPVLGVIAVAALVYGVFRMGLPPEATDAAAMPPQASAGAQPTDGASRMAELEARLVDAPDDVAANLELGVLLFNAGDSDRAEDLWTRVTEVDPSNPQAWYNLGFVHLAEEPPDAAAAKADWDKVLEVAPDSDLGANVRAHLDALDAMTTASPTPSPAPTKE